MTCNTDHESVLYADENNFCDQMHIHNVILRNIQEHCVLCYSDSDQNSFIHRMHKIHSLDLHDKNRFI